MRQGTIYLITNLINENKYVGQTVMQLNKRWLAHIQESKTYSERPLYRAINKYGIENFKIKILEECNEDVLSDREMYWIEKLNTYHNGYNQNINESEQINNISKALKEKVNRGEKWGFMLTPNEGGKHCKRKIEGINVKTGEIVEFDSITEAAEKVNGKNSNISKALKDGFNAYGYKWKKLDNRPIARPVIGYDKKTGKIVYEYESIGKAEIDIRGKTGTGIIKSLKNPGKNSWMNCYWYYTNSII